MSLASLLGDAGRSGVYRLPAGRGAEIAEAGRDAGLIVRHLSFAGVQTVAELLVALAKALSFPDWFGANLDALMDCLTDLSWEEGSNHGQLLLLADLESLARSDPEGLDGVLAVLHAASEVWRADQVPFWALAERDGLPDFPDLP